MMSDDNQDEDQLPEEDFADQDATVTPVPLRRGGRDNPSIQAAGWSRKYIEDCEVCCRPWRVTLHCSGDDGRASVELEPG